MKKYNKLIIFKSIFCIVLCLIALIIGLIKKSVKHQFLISKEGILILIGIFLVIGIVVLIMEIIKKTNKKRIYDCIDIVLYIGDVLAFLFILTTCIISPVRVDGDSMNDTYYDGDVLLISKINKLNHDDIAVFSLEDSRLDELGAVYKENLQDELLIKRIVGIPGDTVSIYNNTLSVNDAEIQSGVSSRSIILDDLSDGKIPEGYCLVLGDNRNNSTDSRIFGLIRIDNIVGYVVCKI